MTHSAATIETLRDALGHLLGAERRARGRGNTTTGELTYAQVRAIALLGREGQMTAGELAKYTELNPATITGMLDHLEAAGLVARQRSTADRRVCHVSLTPAGDELCAHKLSNWQRLWEERLSEFAPGELDAAVRVMGRIAEIFESLYRAAPEAAPSVSSPATPERARATAEATPSQ